MTEKEIIGKMNDFWAQSGKSKAEMSRELGVDAGTFGNILNGNRGVSAGLLSKFLETYPSVSGVGSMFAADGHVGGENIANNNNSQINAGDTINRLVSLLEEKDKHINQLLQILASK